MVWQRGDRGRREVGNCDARFVLGGGEGNREEDGGNDVGMCWEGTKVRMREKYYAAKAVEV